MDWNEALKIVGSVLGGGFIVALFNHLTEGRKMHIADKDDLIERINVILQKCEDDRAKLATNVELNKIKIDELQQEIRFMRKSQLEIIMPSWRTTLDGRYLSVNDACVTMVLAPLGMRPEDVLGLTAEEVWEPHVVSMINEMSRKALISPLKCTTLNDFVMHKDLPRFNITKYVIHIDDPDSPVGFINYAVPCERTAEEIRRRKRQIKEDKEDDA